MQANTTQIKKIWREKIGDVDKKIPDVSGWVTTTGFNSKIAEVKNKIPDTSGLVTTNVLHT